MNSGGKVWRMQKMDAGIEVNDSLSGLWMSDALDDFNDTFTPVQKEASSEVPISILIAVLAAMLVAAVIGNSFMLLALWMQMRLKPRSRIYLFMLHLSVADLAVALFTIFPQMMWFITQTFKGGDLLCRLVKYLQIMALYLSSYMVVVMAVDRYRALCLSSRPRADSLKVAKGLVAAAWGVSLLFAVPLPLLFQMRPINSTTDTQDCRENYSTDFKKVYMSWFMISNFLLPLIVLMYCYGCITYTLWSYNSMKKYNKERKESLQSSGRFNSLHNGSSSPAIVNGTTTSYMVTVTSPKAQANISSAKLRTIKMTLAVVICFLLCSLPFTVTLLAKHFFDANAGRLGTICALLPFLNSCTNPWIYLVFSNSLMNHLRSCLGLSESRKRKHRNSIGDAEEHEAPQAARVHAHKDPPKGKQVIGDAL